MKNTIDWCILDVASTYSRPVRPMCASGSNIVTAWLKMKEDSRCGQKRGAEKMTRELTRYKMSKYAEQTIKLEGKLYKYCNIQMISLPMKCAYPFFMKAEDCDKKKVS